MPKDFESLASLVPNSYPPTATMVPEPQKLVIALFLEVGERSSLIQHYPFNRITQCRFEFLSTITGSSGSSLSDVILVSSMTFRPAQCEFEKFRELKENVIQMIDQVSRANSPIELVNLNYAVQRFYKQFSILIGFFFKKINHFLNL